MQLMVKSELISTEAWCTIPFYSSMILLVKLIVAVAQVNTIYQYTEMVLFGILQVSYAVNSWKPNIC